MFGFVSLQVFNDGRFCSVASFQGWSVKLSYKSLMFLFGDEISRMASFVPL